MLRKLLFLLILFSSTAGAAEVYRGVDERGVTHYGEKPPDNRPAKPVNTRPAAASVDAGGKVLEPVAKPASAGFPPFPASPAAAPNPPPPAPHIALAPPAPVTPPAPAAARGMEFGVYIHLRRGMSEGEVLLRAGKPDHETVEGFRNFVVKSLYYYPTMADPFITVVTLRGGRVANLERTRKTF